ncbi:hypothetical protein TYRP_008067 [Tyrophagus putrescentiae]|nr:hypothetical protein TYRP_008067 [Tyrophagus putrescentiae]
MTTTTTTTTTPAALHEDVASNNGPFDEPVLRLMYLLLPANAQNALSSHRLLSSVGWLVGRRGKCSALL